jgi:hypothetical protein
MRDYVSLGTTPVDEYCCDLHDITGSRAECRRFIAQLRNQFGNEPEGAELKIKSNPHDFGTYLDVVCYYEEENEEDELYAFNLEENLPEKWEEESV